MAPIVAALAKWGMTTLAGAVAAKGKEAIEDKLGIDLDNALGTEEGRIRLRQAEMQHEVELQKLSIEQAELELKAEQTAQSAVTDRWQADMASDSRLAKNVRPAVLIFLTLAVTAMAFLNGATAFKPDEAYVTLFENLLMLVFAAYFVGRTAEKGLSTWRKK